MSNIKKSALTLTKKRILHCRDKRKKRGEKEIVQQSLPSSISDLPLSHSRPCVSDVRMHARSATMKTDPSRRVGRPSWLMSSRAPSMQPRNANFLVASALFFFKLFFLFSYFTLFSLVYLPSSAPSAARERERESLVSSFLSFLTLRTRIVDDSRVQTFAFRLRNEARHPLPGTCKMAEFNGKAPIRAIRCSDYDTGRGGPLILITLISPPLL